VKQKSGLFRIFSIVLASFYSPINVIYVICLKKNDVIVVGAGHAGSEAVSCRLLI
jgi:hypothetical protein